jgi:hypothetical protein
MRVGSAAPISVIKSGRLIAYKYGALARPRSASPHRRVRLRAARLRPRLPACAGSGARRGGGVVRCVSPRGLVSTRAGPGSSSGRSFAHDRLIATADQSEVSARTPTARDRCSEARVVGILPWNAAQGTALRQGEGGSFTSLGVRPCRRVHAGAAVTDA